jgi:hypothetical protein
MGRSTVELPRSGKLAGLPDPPGFARGAARFGGEKILCDVAFLAQRTARVRGGSLVGRQIWRERRLPGTELQVGSCVRVGLGDGLERLAWVAGDDLFLGGAGAGGPNCYNRIDSTVPATLPNRASGILKAGELGGVI